MKNDPLTVTGVITVAKGKERTDEDACALMHSGNGDVCLIACFDGCGGSGAKRYPAAKDWTGARLASHCCGNALCDWFVQNGVGAYGTQGVSGERIAKSLQQAIDENLHMAKDALKDKPSGLISSMIKTLPTTLSAVLLDAKRNDEQLRCLYLWAGDSRGYLFSPAGLQQITIDDVNGGLDPFENQSGAAMNNVISADAEYCIHVRELMQTKPCMFITATDGCFDYFLTPMSFEGALLSTLLASDTPDSWKRNLTKELDAVAQDDFTMQIAVAGFRSFQSLKDAYKKRADAFQRQYGAITRRNPHGKDPASRQQIWEEQRRYWESYKAFYLY